MKTLIGRKVGMTSQLLSDGSAVAITLLSVTPSTVTQVKDLEKDGYLAVQIGFESTKPAKPQAGHLKPAKASSKIMREVRIDDLGELKVGDTLAADIFEVGDQVDVIGTSKGKGWAGTIKRHNFHRGRKTHGGRSYRRPGSIGSMYPQRIFAGKKMAGQMGHNRVTVKNLEVTLVDTENAVIGIKGAVPGPRKSIVMIKGVK